MQSVLIVIHILIVVALIAVVLLQRSEGGALGAGGGTGSFMTGRGQANALSRATAILGAMFFATRSSAYSWSGRSMMRNVNTSRTTGVKIGRRRSRPVERADFVENMRMGSGGLPIVMSSAARARHARAAAKMRGRLQKAVQKAPA